MGSGWLGSCPRQVFEPGDAPRARRGRVDLRMEASALRYVHARPVSTVRTAPLSAASPHSAHPCGRHFGRQAKHIGSVQGQYVPHEQAELKFDGNSSSAVSPAARGRRGCSRPGCAHPTLSPHERRAFPWPGSSSGAVRGECATGAITRRMVRVGPGTACSAKPRHESPPRGEWGAAGPGLRACPAAPLFFSYALTVSPPAQERSSSGSLGRTIVAVLVLLVVGYFLLHVLIGVAVAIAGFAVVILAIVAIVWAVKVLF